MNDHQTIIDAMPEAWQDHVAAYLSSVRDAENNHYTERGRYVQRLRTNSAPGGPDGWTEPLTVAVDMAESLRCWHRVDVYESFGGCWFAVVIESANKSFHFDFGPEACNYVEDL